MSIVGPGLVCCCVCGDKDLKFHDPELEGFTPGGEAGVTYGEEIMGSYDWADIVKPVECSNGHYFYVPAKRGCYLAKREWGL